MKSPESAPKAPKGAARQAKRAQRWIIVGSTSLSLGIFTSLTGTEDLGAQLTIVGFIAAVFGLHLLGRSGPLDSQTTPTSSD